MVGAAIVDGTVPTAEQLVAGGEKRGMHVEVRVHPSWSQELARYCRFTIRPNQGRGDESGREMRAVGR